MPVVGSSAYNTAGQITSLVRSLLNDAQGNLFTDTVLLPYANSAYPPIPNTTWLYICYSNTPGVDYGGPPAGQGNTDLNVIVLYTYAPLTPLIGGQFGTFRLANNQHMTVQGP